MNCEIPGKLEPAGLLSLLIALQLQLALPLFFLGCASEYAIEFPFTLEMRISKQPKLLIYQISGSSRSGGGIFFLAFCEFCARRLTYSLLKDDDALPFVAVLIMLFSMWYFRNTALSSVRICAFDLLCD